MIQDDYYIDVYYKKDLYKVVITLMNLGEERSNATIKESSIPVFKIGQKITIDNLHVYCLKEGKKEYLNTRRLLFIKEY